MKSSGKCMALFLAVLLIVFTTAATPVFGYGIKLIEKIEFSPDAEFPSILRSFCVTEDNLVIIPDKKSGNIKIYEQKEEYLKLAKILGQKGFGIDDLGEPTFCFYNRNEGKFGFIDYLKGEIAIYERLERLEFQRICTIACLDRGYDIQLSGNFLIISGYKVDQNRKPYDLYYFKLDDLALGVEQDKIITAQPNFLLPSYMKYNLNNPQEYNPRLLIEDDIISIGTYAWFDVQGEDIYFAWEGDLRILKININSGGNPTYFGEKTTRYIKPYVSTKARIARRNRDFKTFQSERTKMSYIRNIFTNPTRYVLVVLEGPEESNFWLQFYTLDGGFLKEVPIPGQPPGKRMYFDKDLDILYALSDEEKEGAKYLMKYKISE